METSQWRTKSPISLEEEIKKTAKNIFEDFADFTDGYRTLFLIHRHKEGGETNNTKAEKIITKDSKEWLKKLEELLRKKMTSDIPYRIYGSLNERNFEKAIRQFKYEQLDADYFTMEQEHGFYLDLKNRFFGCLMQPASRQTSLFLFDVDNEEGRDVMGETLQVLPNDHIIKQYPTKNGWHIITKPFDYTKIVLPKGVEFKKDALILLSF